MPNTVVKTYFRSYIDKDLDGYSLSGDYNTPINITDRNKNTFCITSGLGTDGDSAEMIIDMITEREVDTIAIKSNLKTFTVYYWDGAAYQQFETYAANTYAFLVIDKVGSGQTTSKIKITATHTITADEEKKIYICDVTKFIDDIEPQTVKPVKSYVMSNFTNLYGGSVKITKYANHPKVSLSMDFANLEDHSHANYEAYDTIKSYHAAYGALIYYIYLSDDYNLFNISAWYLMNDLDDQEETPAKNNFASGVKGSFKLKEC